MLWSINETRRLNELQAQKKTVEEIEEIMKISQLDIINKLISMGHKPLHKKFKLEQTLLQKKNDSGQTTLFNDRKKRTTVTPKIEQRVIQLRKQRFNFSEISKRTGVSQSTASRIVSKHGLPSEKRYTDAQKEPAPVAAETSSENTKNQNKNNTNLAVCKELISEAKETLENAEPRKTFNSIGKALGYIEAALKLMEVEK